MATNETRFVPALFIGNDQWEVLRWSKAMRSHADCEWETFPKPSFQFHKLNERSVPNIGGRLIDQAFEFFRKQYPSISGFDAESDSQPPSLVVIGLQNKSLDVEELRTLNTLSELVRITTSEYCVGKTPRGSSEEVSNSVGSVAARVVIVAIVSEPNIRMSEALQMCGIDLIIRPTSELDEISRNIARSLISYPTPPHAWLPKSTIAGVR